MARLEPVAARRLGSNSGNGDDQKTWNAVLATQIQRSNVVPANTPPQARELFTGGEYPAFNGKFQSLIGLADSPPPTRPDPTPTTNANDWWESLTGSSDPTTLNSLQQIADHWDEWGFHQGVTFKYPADDNVNPDAKGFIEYVAQNPAILDAWLKYSNTPDGKVTKAGLDKMLAQYKSDIGNASSSYQTWLRNNPNATDAEKKEAQQLAIIWANQSIIGGGNQYLDLAHLDAFAKNNPGFDPAVTDATKAWADPTKIADVDNAGFSWGQVQLDGLFDGNNIKSWLNDNRAVDKADADIWGSLGANDDERAKYGEPLSVSEDLYNNWDKWGFHDQGSTFYNTSDPAAQEVVDVTKANPALLDAWDRNHDGTVTRAELGDYISSTKADIKSAEAAYKDYLAKNPNADPASKELAKEAALVAANRNLIGGGSEYLSSQQLSDFANRAGSNPGIDPDIFNAAKFMSDPGVLRQFDIAGDNPADTKYDGTFGVDNVVQWLGKYAPKDASEFAQFLNAAATSSLVSGVDTSGLGPDVFVHPEKYTGEQKAAVLQQLMDAYTTFQAGISSELWNPYGQNGLNGNKAKMEDDLTAKIAQLSSDKDVQDFLANEKPKALQNILNSSPDLKTAVTDYYNNSFASGATFNDILGKKDANGNPISLDDAVADFVITGQIMHSALGLDGNPDLMGALQKSGHYDEVKQYYLDNIVTGKSLKDAIAGGTDIETALTNFYGDVAAFNSVLDPKLVQDNVATLDSNTMDIVADKLLGDGTADDLKAAFGDANGNLDEGKLLDILNKAQADNPDLFVAADGTVIKPDQIVAAFRGVFDDVRQGAKITDALDKLFKSFSKPDNGVMSAYSKGVFHLVSALFMGGVLGARAGSGSNTPSAQAGKVAAGFQLAGLLLEGSSKYTKSIDAASRPANWLSNANLAKIENYGKLLGGVGSLLGGGFGIASGVNALHHGDKVGAGISLTGGLLGILSGLASGGEAVASLLGSGLAAGFGLASGVLGLVGGFFAFGAVIGLSIWEVVKHAKQQDKFYDNLVPTLSQYGINGGPMSTDDMPDDVPTGGGGL